MNIYVSLSMLNVPKTRKWRTFIIILLINFFLVFKIWVGRGFSRRPWKFRMPFPEPMDTSTSHNPSYLPRPLLLWSPLPRSILFHPSFLTVSSIFLCSTCSKPFQSVFPAFPRHVQTHLDPFSLDLPTMFCYS